MAGEAYSCTFCGTEIVQQGGVPRPTDHGQCPKTNDGTHSWKRES